jgi:hypothetical protein
MWNYMFYEHRQADPQYQGILLWDLDNKEKRGWGSRQKVKATNIGTYLSCILYKKS